MKPFSTRTRNAPLRLTLGVLLLVAGLSASSCNSGETASAPEKTAAAAATQATPDTPDTPADVADSTAVLWTATVEGMTCAINCAPQVKTALESIDGVRSVEVDFDTKTARILADPTLELTTEICDRSFANQGYFLEELHRNEGS